MSESYTGSPLDIATWPERFQLYFAHPDPATWRTYGIETTDEEFDHFLAEIRRSYLREREVARADGMTGTELLWAMVEAAAVDQQRVILSPGEITTVFTDAGACTLGFGGANQSTGEWTQYSAWHNQYGGSPCLREHAGRGGPISIVLGREVRTNCIFSGVVAGDFVGIAALPGDAGDALLVRIVDRGRDLHLFVFSIREQPTAVSAGQGMCYGARFREQYHVEPCPDASTRGFRISTRGGPWANTSYTRASPDDILQLLQWPPTFVEVILAPSGGSYEFPSWVHLVWDPSSGLVIADSANLMPPERFRNPAEITDDFVFVDECAGLPVPLACPPLQFAEPGADRYEGGILDLPAEQEIRIAGLNQLRSVAVAPDGSLYVTDTGTHSVAHLSRDGRVLQVWGVYDPAADAPGGRFYEPWGLAVAADGSVYIADTWHHRVQHFTAEGAVLGMINGFTWANGYTETFWGPRALAIDRTGRVFVADTGNHRVVVLDANGEFLEVIGNSYRTQFCEPVGLAVSGGGGLFVADAWNRRVQVLRETEVAEWPVEGWYGDSADNKPFLAVSDDGRVCVSDPERARILCFTEQGEYLFGWRTTPAGSQDGSLPTGAAFDRNGDLWVADAARGVILRYVLPSP